MRETIIRTLDYPRALARGNMELHSCAHAGNYDVDDRTCRECGFELECGWLLHNDLDSVLRTRSLTELIEALNFALSYVDAQVTRWGRHPRRSCGCDACRWLREAAALKQQLSREAPRNDREADP